MSVPKAGALAKASDWTTQFQTDTDAWPSYTPVWTASGTAPAIGNGSIVGAYMKIGRRVDFRIVMTTGSTSTYGTGNYFWSLPVTANAVFAGVIPVGRAAILDTSAGTRFFRDIDSFGTGIVIGFTEAGATITQTAPMTWATGDQIAIAGTYESAS